MEPTIVCRTDKYKLVILLPILQIF